MMSDGYPEMINGKGETLDDQRVTEAFQEAGHLTPEQIIRHLVEKGEVWSEGRPLADDVTFVVVKAV
jgi:serine phosphatase RsbU (regulator of sigma subunit)